MASEFLSALVHLDLILLLILFEKVAFKNAFVRLTLSLKLCPEL